MIKNTDEYTNSENNEPPTYNNTIQMISIENLNTIKDQIKQQSKIIDDLKKVLENQKKISSKMSSYSSNTSTNKSSNLTNHS